MELKIKLFGIALMAMISCKNQTQTIETDTHERHLKNASVMVSAMKYDSAMAILRNAFEQGFPKPMDIIRDSNFYALIDEPRYRSVIRTLLKEFSVESQSTMVRDEEPGASIFIRGVIRDESNDQAMDNVAVELVHADHNGNYFDETSVWNPRLFSYLKTDANGEFRVRTILPGRYSDDDGHEVASHIHFTLEAVGYRTYASEFTFENDPVIQANGNVDAVPVARVEPENGEDHYQVTLYMQKQ